LLLFYSPPAMFISFNNTVSSAPREMCEDAPCCGCCGHNQYEYEPDYEHADRWDYPEEPEEEPEEDSEESWEGGEDSYLDASWEDRFEMDMGDY
jgi:hypothetical protein